ncbi:T-complex protein 1 subunit delta [Trichinella spiralis]|uniref:T-complex protein 1 subunit delta n=1 Tax=Trichinella spiralis TaxID=6334 RepID=A0ABR3KSH4_TRISP
MLNLSRRSINAAYLGALSRVINANIEEFMKQDEEYSSFYNSFMILALEHLSSNLDKVSVADHSEVKIACKNGLKYLFLKERAVNSVELKNFTSENILLAEELHCSELLLKHFMNFKVIRQMRTACQEAVKRSKTNLIHRQDCDQIINRYLIFCVDVPLQLREQSFSQWHKHCKQLLNIVGDYGPDVRLVHKGVVGALSASLRKALRVFKWDEYGSGSGDFFHHNYECAVIATLSATCSLTLWNVDDNYRNCWSEIPLTSSALYSTQFNQLEECAPSILSCLSGSFAFSPEMARTLATAVFTNSGFSALEQFLSTLVLHTNEGPQNIEPMQFFQNLMKMIPLLSKCEDRIDEFFGLLSELFNDPSWRSFFFRKGFFSTFLQVTSRSVSSVLPGTDDNWLKLLLMYISANYVDLYNSSTQLFATYENHLLRFTSFFEFCRICGANMMKSKRSVPTVEEMAHEKLTRVQRMEQGKCENADDTKENKRRQ